MAKNASWIPVCLLSRFNSDMARMTCPFASYHALATITMTTTLVIQESSADLKWLTHNHYSLQVAKSVSYPGDQPQFNVVYRSHKLAPHMTVSWTPQYGLNWTTQMPARGAQVVNSGNWQPCDLGQSYNLTSDGEWVINNDDPHPCL